MKVRVCSNNSNWYYLVLSWGRAKVNSIAIELLCSRRTTGPYMILYYQGILWPEFRINIIVCLSICLYYQGIEVCIMNGQNLICNKIVTKPWSGRFKSFFYIENDWRVTTSGDTEMLLQRITNVIQTFLMFINIVESFLAYKATSSLQIWIFHPHEFR